MKRLVKIAVACALFGSSTAGHAAKFKFDLDAEPGQHSRMDHGMKAIDSDEAKSSVRLFETEGTVKKRGTLMLYALNAGSEPVNLGVENVTMETSSGEPIEMISYERLVKEEKKRRAWAAVAAGLSAMSNSLAASNAGYTNGTVSAYGSGGWATGTYSGYNGGQAYAAQSIANAQNQANFQRLAETNAAAMQALRVNLRTTTIDPGNSFGGQVMYELPKDVRSSKEPVTILIHVKIGDEMHDFLAHLVRQ
ncbi:hypothetical protein GRI58_03660 [Porphyrobacter algicida]|uniref:Uncharacterized protein n=1 Tax=Qipengyuania algicida TaxID=1836209 RepID=A0A845ALM1_9SPHN|nr:hypothetical protein [Qipengyuania algicida]MXP27918.1 hypothetical protein [Qipengyuania algicida]